MGGAIPRVYDSGRHVVASPLRNPWGRGEGAGSQKEEVGQRREGAGSEERRGGVRGERRGQRKRRMCVSQTEEGVCPDRGCGQMGGGCVARQRVWSDGRSVWPDRGCGQMGGGCVASGYKNGFGSREEGGSEC